MDQLLRYLVGRYSDPAGLVVDASCGTGDTLVAALSAGRNAYGVDPDPANVLLAGARLSHTRRHGALGRATVRTGTPAELHRLLRDAGHPPIVLALTIIPIETRPTGIAQLLLGCLADSVPPGSHIALVQATPDDQHDLLAASNGTGLVLTDHLTATTTVQPWQPPAIGRPAEGLRLVTHTAVVLTHPGNSAVPHQPWRR